MNQFTDDFSFNLTFISAYAVTSYVSKLISGSKFIEEPVTQWRNPTSQINLAAAAEVQTLLKCDLADVH